MNEEASEAPLFPTPAPKGLTQACKSVERVLAQITLNDAPPVNQTERIQLGHDSLTHMCRSSLEAVTHQTQYVPLQSETELLLSQLEVHLAHTSSDAEKEEAVGSTASATSSTTGSKRTMKWFRRHKNKVDTSISASGDDAMSVTSHTTGAHSVLSNTQPRLQQFGSEYAQHLSQSKLCSTSSTKSAPSKSSRHHRHKHLPVTYYQNASPEIRAGALLDITLVKHDEETPTTYLRLSTPWKDFKFDFCLKKEPDWNKATQRPCISSICVIYPDKYEFVPPGYTLLKDSANQPVVFPGGAHLVVCKRRDGNPIVDVTLLQGQAVPTGHTVVEKTPRHYSANMKGTFVAYRQRLSSLEALRPQPLVDSVTSSTMRAYYATGGTTISANVGKYHILDRSTHKLRCPHSMERRLELLGKSSSRVAEESEDSSEDNEPHTFSYLSEADTSLLLALIEPEKALAFIPKASEDDHKCALLCPILTACYLRHGGACLAAIEELQKLLVNGFFVDACDGDVSLLDLAVQAVCDAGLSSAHETFFATCLDFCSSAARSQHLSTRTIGILVRFYLFVFYFGVSTPTTHATFWPCASWRTSDGEGDFSMLLEPENETYLPGGAPQGAALALKELVTLLVDQLGGLGDSVPTASTEASSMDDHVIDELLSATIDNSMDLVERSNLVQLTLQQVHRSGGAELFWHDVSTVCGAKLFENDSSYVDLFAVLASLVKIASGKTRAGSQVHTRVLASKLLSLELLLHLLETFSDDNGDKDLSLSGETFVFAVRRLVVSSMLANTRLIYNEPLLYRRVIRIVSELWGSLIFRERMRAEIGLLMDHFAIRLLHLSPQLVPLKASKVQGTLSLYAQQLEAIQEVKTWFEDPLDTVELFLNYDAEVVDGDGPSPQLLMSSRLKVAQKLCAGLSAIAEQCGVLIGLQIRESQRRVLREKVTDVKSTKASARTESMSDEEYVAMREAAKSLRSASLDAILHIVKSLALASVAACDSDSLSMILSFDSGNQHAMSSLLSATGSLLENLDGACDSEAGEGSAVDKTASTDVSMTEQGSNVDEHLDTALEIASKKNIKKALEYLLACGVLGPSSRDIASFLRLHQQSLDPVALGDYLGESGLGREETEFYDSVRYAFVRAISFVGMHAEEALRHFLTGCGFRLPGEAQRVDKLISTFSRVFFEDNAGDSECCPFKTTDTVYVLAFAVIMLNSDLSQKSKKNHMTQAQFIHNLRGVEEGNDIPQHYLAHIYDSIKSSPIVMERQVTAVAPLAKTEAVLSDMVKNVRNVESLLRDLAVQEFPFATVESASKKFGTAGAVTLVESVRGFTSKTWHHWYGAINTCLETAHLDPQGMQSSVGVLFWSICLTVTLESPTERTAFLNQLGRLKVFQDQREGNWCSTPGYDSYRSESWFMEVSDAAVSELRDRRRWSIKSLHTWTNSLFLALANDAENQRDMADAVMELKDAQYLSEDPARRLIRDGSLIKKSHRTGKHTMYRFYLFSDVLLYASRSSDGKFRIHDQLPLHLIKVDSYSTRKSGKNSFEILHPVKRFQVICSSPQERQIWVALINESAQNEIRRKARVEAARRATSL